MNGGESMYITIFLVIIALFVGVTVIFVTRANRKQKITADQYLTARSSTKWIQVAASMLAVLMGSWALFSPAESVIYGGLPTAIMYALGCFLGIMLFSFLGSKLRRTLPNGSSGSEFMLARYGKVSYWLFALLGVFMMACAMISELTGLSAAVQTLWGIPSWLVIIALLVGVVIYTTYGGLKASLFSDTLQTILIIPTLLVAFFAIIALVGGFDTAWTNTAAASPDTVDLGFAYGWEYGGGLAVGLFTAAMVDQTYWQRAYAVENTKDMSKAFALVAVVSVPLMLLCCGFGILAMGSIEIQNPSIALFELMGAVAPVWLQIVVMVLAIALVMSTAGALMNGFTSVIAVEIKNTMARRAHAKAVDNKKLLRGARIAGIVVAVICGALALNGFSVLYLYTIANLVVCAIAFPMIYGLYNKRLKDWGVLVAWICGVGVSLIWIPDPTWTTGNNLLCLGSALVVPIIVSLIFGCFGKPIEMDTIRERIIGIQEEQAKNLEGLDV